jgi:GNAT superfamily N-acetyltransferase
MQVRKLDTTQRAERERFVDFLFGLYKDAPMWVPPLRSAALKALDKSQHPYYQHSDADFYLVEENGRPLGRMAMLENNNFNRHHGSKAAFFGYFEVVENREAAHALLSTAVEWARGRGLNTIIGPRGLVGIDGSVLVDGFEYRPALTIPWNFPYYDEYIRSFGFVKDADYLSGYIPGDTPAPDRVKAIAEKVKERRGFRIKTFKDRAEIQEWIPKAMEIHSRAMSELHSYYPPTEAETRELINTLLQIVDPTLIKLIMKDDEVAGFILAYPDISRGLQKANGRLFPFGWIHILRDRQTTDWVNINGLGLLPKYRGLGANAMLYAELAQTVNDHGFKHADLVQVNEANFNSRSDQETLGAVWYKRHRHYKLDLT